MSQVNFNRLKNQINKSFSISAPLNRPKKSRKPKKRKSANKKTSNKSNKGSFLWDFLYLFVTFSLIFMTATLLYNIFVAPIYQPVTIETKIRKAPSGSLTIQKTLQGSPSRIPIGNSTGDKYSSLYGADNFLKQGGSSYPNIYGSSTQGPDDGATKGYYINTMNKERQKLNNYIRKQNMYIRRVNNRVRQINDDRVYNPTYIRDQAVLSELREYERKLANKVVIEGKNQPYLSDQARVYY